MNLKPAPPVPISSCMRTKCPTNAALLGAALGKPSIFLASKRIPRTPAMGTGASMLRQVLAMALLMAIGLTCDCWGSVFKVYSKPLGASTPLAKRERFKSSAAHRMGVSNTGSLIK